jgi:hypothetical protein
MMNLWLPGRDDQQAPNSPAQVFPNWVPKEDERNKTGGLMMVNDG